MHSDETWLVQIFDELSVWVCLSVCVCVCVCSTLLALHCTAHLRHDVLGQETLLNLLLRNYIAYNLYEQVWGSMGGASVCINSACVHEQT